MSSTREPMGIPLVMMEVLPRNRDKSWHYEKKLNCFICRLRFCSCGYHHFKISEIIGGRVQGKERSKGNWWSHLCSYATKTLHLLQIICLSPVEVAAFMWVQDYYEKGIPINSNMIWVKAKSVYDNLLLNHWNLGLIPIIPLKWLTSDFLVWSPVETSHCLP